MFAHGEYRGLWREYPIVVAVERNVHLSRAGALQPGLAPWNAEHPSSAATRMEK
jgi:hypothetical protein